MGNCGGSESGLSQHFAYGKLHEIARVRRAFVFWETAAEVKVAQPHFAYGKLHEIARVRRAFMLWETAAEVKVGSAHTISEKERVCFV